MIRLSFDTSTKDLIVALDCDGTLFTRVEKDCLKGHSEILIPTIDDLLREAGKTVGEVDAFGVCIGPGSFTGIRIGVTTARTFCQVTGKPCIPVNSLEYRAYTAMCRKPVCAVLDAMQQKLYYLIQDGRQTQPSVCERGELASLIPAGCRILSDTPLDGLAWEPYGDLGAGLARFVCENADRGGTYRDVQPLYVRKCQAEESLAAKA